MKVSVVTSKLSRSLATVLKIVSNQVTLPILSNVLLTTDNGRLKISATDLELGIETWIGAKIIKEGTVSIPAKLFYELVSSTSDEKIDIEAKDNKINITGQNTKSLIKGLPADDFPLIPKIKGAKAKISIKADRIKQIADKTGFACATDETRPVLTGILLSASKDKLKFASTDSYRLTQLEMEEKNSITDKISIVIPRRTMIELGRIAGNSEEKAIIEISENQISVSLGDVYFVSRLVEGSFPEYEQIIPKKFNTSVVIEKPQLEKYLKTATLFSRDSANNIKVELDADGPKMKIMSYSQQLGENESNFSPKSVDGKNVKFSINAMFLHDALNAIDDKLVEMQLVDANSPILIKSAENDEYFCIIMPLRQEE